MEKGEEKNEQKRSKEKIGIKDEKYIMEKEG